MSHTIKMFFLLLVFIIFHVMIMSCSKVQNESFFLIEGNISGLDIDLSLGGFEPAEVELKLVIPLIKQLALNPNIVSIKYQIHPTYFRLFIKASDRVSPSDMQEQLILMVNNLPKSLKTNTLYNAYTKDEKYYIFGNPLVLPLSNMTEEKISTIVPETSGQTLVVDCDESRMIAFGIQYRDVIEALAGARYQLDDNGNSLLVTNPESTKEMILSKTIVDRSGKVLFLKDFVSDVKYLYGGINRDWTLISQYK